MSGNPYNTPQPSQNDNAPAWNPRHYDGPLSSRRIAFAPPTNATPANGINSASHGNMAMGSNGYYTPNFSSAYPNYQTANQGALHNGYMHFSSPGASYHPVSGNGFPTIPSQMDSRRVPLKRKHTDAYFTAEGTSAGGYPAGSSSNHSFSADQSQYNHIPAPAFRPPAVPFNIAPISTGEGSTRHVRSRISHAFPHESASPATYSSTNTHPFFYPSSSTAPGVPEQWRNAPTSMASQVQILPTGTPLSNTAIPRGREYLYQTTHNNNMSAPMATLHGPPGGIVPSRNNFPLRAAASHEANPSYKHIASTATSVGAGLPFGPEVVASARHTGHGIVGHSSIGRTRRARSSYYGAHSSVDSETFNRWASEHFVLIDPSFYNPGELFDAHGDMRLDIDNMSYEELLDLEERIGSVSTGLPDETISTCLTETACCLSIKTQNDGEEGNCIICLEEYTDGSKLGRLSCGHDFHADCIKKWLQVKNCCPVCKAAASEDTTTKSK